MKPKKIHLLLSVRQKNLKKGICHSFMQTLLVHLIPKGIEKKTDMIVTACVRYYNLQTLSFYFSSLIMTEQTYLCSLDAKSK